MVPEAGLNIHSHRIDGLALADADRILSEPDRSPWEVICVDPSQAELLPRFPSLRFALGLHPWRIPDEPDRLQEALTALSRQAGMPQVCLIGETGLDGRASCFRSDRAYRAQEEVLRAHAAVAERVRKPMVLHIVRRFDVLMQLCRQLKPSVPWIIHGFAKNRRLAEQLMDHACFLSFGTALLTHPELADVWRSVPLDRVFLETDDDHGHTLASLYRHAAALRDMPVDELQRQLVENLLRITATSAPSGKGTRRLSGK